jgi:hypothetical protein
VAIGFWALVNDSGAGNTQLQKITTIGSIAQLGLNLVLPEPLTRNGDTDISSTAAICSLPYDRTIVYIAGRSDSTGELVAWRCDTVAETFDELMREPPATGTWPWAMKLYAGHQSNHERVYLAVGNGSGWGVFANQNPEFPQGVWLSDLAGAFSSLGLGREWAYSGSNINHPNSLTDLYALEDPADPPSDVLVTGHTVTWVFANPPNVAGNWAIADVNSGGGWLHIPHSTGLRFVGGWQTSLSREGTNPTSDADAWGVTNGSGVGPYSFADTNFGVPISPLVPGSGAVNGTYHSNSRCLVFPDNLAVLVAFAVGSVGQGEIYRHSPITGAEVLIFSDTNVGQFPSTAVLVSETGGIAAALSGKSFGACHLLVSSDYGASFLVHDLVGWAGMALTEANPDALSSVPVFQQTATWMDDRGFTGNTNFYVGGGDEDEARLNGLAIVNALTSITRGQLISAKGAYTLPPTRPDYGDSLPYNFIESELLMTFITDDDVAVNLSIPTPVDNSFVSDQETISILNVAVNDVVTAALDHLLCTRGGVPVLRWVGAQRVMRAQRARQSIRGLDPSETTSSE